MLYLPFALRHVPSQRFGVTMAAGSTLRSPSSSKSSGGAFQSPPTMKGTAKCRKPKVTETQPSDELWRNIASYAPGVRPFVHDTKLSPSAGQPHVVRVLDELVDRSRSTKAGAPRRGLSDRRHLFRPSTTKVNHQSKPTRHKR